jgi:putrescine---pyruvate transaminase
VTQTRFWHGYVDMKAVEDGGELVITRGEGCHVYDETGRRYLDASASLWYCMVGHGRTELADAAARQMSQLAAYSTFGDVTNPPARVLAERVSSLAPVDDPAVFFTSGGSDSIDTALKIARRYWQALGEPARVSFIARQGAYHGVHAGGTSLVGIEAMASGYGPLIGNVAHVQWDSLPAMQEAVDRIGANRIAAIFCEPIIGVGGVLAPPDGYLEGVQELCRETGALMIVDEVVTGFGRVGRWFASERFGLTPDIIVCAKGITSGYLPLGAVIAGARVRAPFYDGTTGPWRHGYTYSGHPTVCAVALANLDIIESEQLLERASRLEVELERRLAPLADHPLVASIRAGVGVLAAVQLDRDAIAAIPALPAQVAAQLRSAGVLTRALVGGELQISPPLVLDDSDLDELVAGFEHALDAQLAAT